MNIEPQTTNLTNDIKNLITTLQEKAIRAVDYQRVLLYWHIGQRILNNQTILASKYQLYLPSEEELVKELCKGLQEMKIITC
ncbi:MAG: hypothetical protein A2329_08000 [Sulfurimonas sp. RIFOXYB2_FULL_37_5]|nr:hypothetical protein [Sulfurimonas sp. RIFOXYB12_FULL_35_9]MDD3856094.1 hypothetical protein [Sulfurimonas sp.]OHE05706.1 MAG: hypothetical protein A2345_00720 [Sulfurimonas sp. RIFOXYB12_FULL_35_9]OHE11491.1 MAG: hypothetical protein A3J96_01845 [Sulfurimonas sp. RIFOXYC2_FULL_36_7]OHE12327.1 MAG: hypothetical protein A2329_08000 [Sulfurimonas sp. RIFOXYB2_FULL_37_5]